MARLDKMVQIGDFNVLVKEITVSQMREIYAGVIEDFGNIDLADLLSQPLDEMLKRLAPYIQVIGDDANMEDMTFSELEKLYVAFKEVNASFFKVVPIDEILANLHSKATNWLGGNLGQQADLTETSAS